MKARILRTWPEVDALEAEWKRLVGRSQDPTVFLTWEFIRAWRNVNGDSAQPFVACVADTDGTLRGVAPLYLTKLRLFGFLDLVALRPLADSNTGAEYPDWIVDSEFEDSVVDEIGSALRSGASDWDVIWLPKVATWNGAHDRIARSAVSNGLGITERDCKFSSIALPDDMQAFEQTFSAKRRQQIRRNTRKVFEDDAVEFERCHDAAELPQYLEALMDLHQRRWKAVGQDGVFKRKPLEADFYREFAPVALANDWLGVFAIRDNGEFKAVQFGYQYSDMFLQLQEGFDPDYRKGGAGNALRHKALEACIDSGQKEYDFLGGTSDHKRRWGADTRIGRDMLIFSKRWKAALMAQAQVWPTGRYAKWLD